jgi:subtilisin-like proprotein convertase family protein
VLAQATTYTTTNSPIAIPDNSNGVFSACQTIVIPPGAGTIADLDIRTAITHTWVGDLTIRLQSPGGASTLMLMNRPGRPANFIFGNWADFNSATPITFNDQAPSGRSAETIGDFGGSPGFGNMCNSSDVVGQNCGPNNYIPAPQPSESPIAGLGTNLAQFNGQSASGTWTLCVADSQSDETGTLVSWSMLVTPVATPPQFGYAPAPGSTVTGTGGGLIGSTSNFTINVSIATPGSGTGTPATTTLTCTAPTGPFAGFNQTVTAVGNGAISGGPLAGTCTRGPTAVTQTLTCTENQGGTSVTRTWTLNCPAGLPAPPVFGYTPAPGSTVTGTGGGLIGSTSNFTITPSIATPGVGTGAAATTTLTCTAPTAPFAGFNQTVTAVGNGAISGGPLAGTCTRGPTAVTQTLTCSENQGGTSVTRTWTLECPAGLPAPPVFGYTPAPGSTVTGTGGGLIGSTSNFTITPSIATPGVGTGTSATTTLTCTAPTAPFAGFNQTVTAVGSGPIQGGPLAGTCTRGPTAVTQTLTCSENQGGTPVTRTWTLECPAGQIPAVPVNATSTWSLIALMLALFGFAAVAVRRQG